MYEDLIKALRCTKNENDDCQACKYQVLYEGSFDYCDQEHLEIDAVDALEVLTNENAALHEQIMDVNASLNLSADACKTIEANYKSQLLNLRGQLAHVTAERDAAMEYIPHDCETCKHWRPRTDNPCAAPDKTPCEYRKRQTWQWRGPQKEG